MRRIAWTSLLVFIAGVAWGQTPAPSVAPFPLELKRTPSGFSKKEADELRSELKVLLRKADALVPDAARLDVALKELRRQDCEREDVCLQQLALKAETLYAVYVSLDYTVEQKVVATGRVVRDDGKLIGEAKTISIPKGREAYREVARVALVQLIEALGVRALPPFRPVEPRVDEPRVTKEPVLPHKEELPPPPPPPTVTSTNPMKTASYVLLGAGGVVAAVGTGLLISSAGDASALHLNNGVVGVPATDDSVRTIQGMQAKQTIGVIALSAGLACAASGAVLLLMPASAQPSPTPSLSLAPTPGGAFATATWALP